MNEGCHNPRESKGRLGILSCKAGEPFARSVFSALEEICKQEKGNSCAPVMIHTKETHFPNTEVKVEIEDSVRGMDLYVIQDAENKEYEPAMFTEHVPLGNIHLPFMPADADLNALVEVKRPFSNDENLRALLTALDAAKRSDADYVTAVVPTFPYARQDKAISREGITASRVAQEIEEHGANRVLTLDLHNRASAGYFRTAVCDNLHASKMIMPYIQQNLALHNLIIASPDEGGITRANYYAKRLGKRLAMGYKKRDYTQASKIEEFRILGDVVRRQRNLDEQRSAIKEVISAQGINPIDAVKRITEILELKAEGYDVLFLDDMIATAGTMRDAVEKAKNLGARDIWFACSLPLFTYPALERMDQLHKKGLLKGVIGTNAVYHDGEKFRQHHPWYHEVDVSKYFANAIFRINHRDSISELIE